MAAAEKAQGVFIRIEIMKSINFDHSYTEDAGHRFFKALGRSGFVLSENEVEHPGKQFCRFIMFKHGSGRVYLEFVRVGKGGEPIDKPGVSLRYTGPLKRYFGAIKARKDIKAKYIHKNYAWKKDSKSALPGWNFLTFLSPKFKNIYLWFTEYEPHPTKKRVTPPPHPNTAHTIAGLELIVRGSDRPKLEKVFGKSLNGKEVSLGGIRLFIESGRSTKVAAVVIKCKDLKRFKKLANIKSTILWRGQSAVLIKNPQPKMWDIVVLEE